MYHYVHAYVTCILFVCCLYVACVLFVCAYVYIIYVYIYICLDIRTDIYLRTLYVGIDGIYMLVCWYIHTYIHTYECILHQINRRESYFYESLCHSFYFPIDEYKKR